MFECRQRETGRLVVGRDELPALISELKRSEASSVYTSDDIYVTMCLYISFISSEARRLMRLRHDAKKAHVALRNVDVIVASIS